MRETPPPATHWDHLGERAHLVQFYEDSPSLLDALGSFVVSALKGGHAAIVVAKQDHLQALTHVLHKEDVDVAAARHSTQYLPLDAAQILPQILTNGWPDEKLFHSQVGTLVSAARKKFGSVRAFGEMVSLLWEKGRYGAAIRLEELWSELGQREPFALFCAYALGEWQGGSSKAERDRICTEHSHLVLDEERHVSLVDAGTRSRAVEDIERRARHSERELVGRRFLERKLAQREQELADFLDQAVIGLHNVDRNGIILWANKAELELLGYTHDDYVGRNFADFHIDTGPASTLLGRLVCGDAVQAERVQLRCQDGTIKDALIDSSPLFRRGEFVHTRCSTRDITSQLRAGMELRKLNDTLEQRIAERTTALRRSELQFQELVTGVVDYAIYMLDVDGYIVSWNVGAERIKGYSKTEAIGKNFAMFYAEEDRAKGMPKRALTIAGTLGKYEAEAWRVRKNGERFWASIVIDAVYDEQGQLVGFAKITRDLTERRAIEEQLRHAQKMEAIGQLTGGVAHDFNNLLTVIVGNLETIWRLAPADDGKLRRAIDQTTRGAQRAVTLTQQLLAFSRRQPLNPKPTDINRLVGGMSDLIRRTIGESIAVETVLAGGLWRVEVDAHQLESALLNLAVNARDAMPNGGKLTIETANSYFDEAYAAHFPELKPGEYVVICVTDTGSGMSPETLARAFEPFFTTKPIGQGTGLGLSQVYGFVKQSGGHVKLYSELGEGTTVKLYMPRLLASVPDEQEARAPIVVNGGRHEVVLVVEDDDDVRMFTTETLRDVGFTVLEASDAPSALRMLEQHPEVQLLFTDVGLPGINGAQLVAEVKVRRPEVKVLFTTGYARNAIVHQGRLDSGVELITKPFTRAQLASRIRDVLDAPVPGETHIPVALVIEDEQLVRMLIVEKLQEMGLSVIETATAAAGLSAARSHSRLDAVIVDRGLPDRDGLEVVSELRTQLPSLPVIVASGYGDGTERSELRKDPFIRFLAKPFDTSALVAVLASLNVKQSQE